MSATTSSRGSGRRWRRESVHTGVHMTTNAERQREALDRRVKVAQLRLAGLHDQRQIADRLGVSQPTISRDFAALDAQFRATAAQDIAAAKGLDVQRLELLISKIWVKATGGDLYAIDRLEKLLNRRAKLLGLDAPKKVEDVTDHRKEAEAIAAEIGKADDPAVVAQIERDLLISVQPSRQEAP